MADQVGPVLRMSDDIDAIVRAVQEDNPGSDITVVDRGAYVRIEGPPPVRVTRETIARNLGRAFEMRELEAIMPSFSGRIQSSTDQIVWTRKHTATV